MIEPERPEAAVLRRPISDAESRRASRRWWDADADAYLAEHGAFLGEVDLVWCPEGLREADARLLGDVRGRRVLELGCGAAAGARWLRRAGAEVVALDLSAGMLRHARAASDRSGVRVPLVQADALALPFAPGAFDVVCTAFGAVPFVADSAAVMREAARVLRPGGSWVFSITHPMRWIFWDEPDETGLIARNSYFDRTPYVEVESPARPSTSSSTARSATGSASWWPPGSCCATWWNRSGRTATRRSGDSGARCADGCSRAPRSSSPTGREPSGRMRSDVSRPVVGGRQVGRGRTRQGPEQTGRTCGLASSASRSSS